MEANIYKLIWIIQTFMEKNTNIFARISQISENKGFNSINDFALNGLGYASAEKINRLKKEGNKPSFEIIEDITNKFVDVDSGWLINGKGEMLKSENLPIAIKNNSFDVGIPLIPLDAMAGIASGEISILELDCERYLIPMFRGADYLIPVKGSSMYPKYNSGDVVACKKVPMHDVFFQWNKVYVLDTNQGAIIKRVGKSEQEGYIKIISENPKYDPFDLKLQNIYAISIVIGVVRLE